MTRYDNHPSPRVRDRHLFAGELVRRQERQLEDRFGTAWRFVNGRGFHTLTHSRFDVLHCAVKLAEATPIVRLLDEELAPLVQVAAIFHAADGTCGDGGPAAAAELAKWPDSVFEARDAQLVANAIGAAAPPRDGAGERSLISLRLDAELDGEAFAGLSQVDQLAAILADADRAHLGLRYGLHRTLLGIVERHREQLPVPAVSDGTEVAPDVELVLDGLAEAADACAAHRFVLAASAQLFPRREENERRLRDAADDLRQGRVTWPELVQLASWEGSRA